MFNSWLHSIRDERGVTLIELVIVLAIMVIVGNIVNISFSSIEKSELNKSCIQLQSDLRYAQRLAIIKGVKHEVFFDVIGKCYKIRHQKEEGFVSYTVLKTVNFNDRVHIDSINVGPDNLIVYNPTGTTNDACTIVLYNDSYVVDLTVNVGSGRIKIKEFTKRAGYRNGS